MGARSAAWTDGWIDGWMPSRAVRVSLRGTHLGPVLCQRRRAPPASQSKRCTFGSGYVISAQISFRSRERTPPTGRDERPHVWGTRCTTLLCRARKTTSPSINQATWGLPARVAEYERGPIRAEPIRSIA